MKKLILSILLATNASAAVKMEDKEGCLRMAQEIQVAMLYLDEGMPIWQAKKLLTSQKEQASAMPPLAKEIAVEVAYKYRTRRNYGGGIVNEVYIECGLAGSWEAFATQHGINVKQYYWARQ